MNHPFTMKIRAAVVIAFVPLLVGCPFGNDDTTNTNTTSSTEVLENANTAVVSQSTITPGDWYFTFTTSAGADAGKIVNNILTLNDDGTGQSKSVIVNNATLPLAGSKATYTISGSTITMLADNGSMNMTGTILTENHMSGTWTKTSGGQSGSWNASKY